MTQILFYHLLSFLMLAAMIVLLKMLFDRMEIKENRSLFLATIGLAFDLIAWFSISHLTNTEAVALCIRLSLMGRGLFGMGHLGYMSRRYNAKLTKPVAAIWLASMIAAFASAMMLPGVNYYLSDVHMQASGSLMVLEAVRGPVYFFNILAIFIMGAWSSVLILKSVSKHKGRVDNMIIVNDLFYLGAIIVVGIAYAIYEVNFGIIINYTPLFKGMAITLYTVLSTRYHFLNYDDVERKGLMSDMGGGFIMLSDNYEVLYANDTACDIFPGLLKGGFTKKEAKEIVNKREYRLEKGGSIFKISAERMLTNGHIDGYTILIVDITDIVQLENKAEINKEAGKNLLTNISHELRTPLNALIGASEMMTADNVSRDSLKEYAEVIRVATINLDDILNDILSASSEYGKESAEDEAPYSICTLIENVVDMCNERVVKKNVKLTLRLAEDIPVNAFGDDKRVRQVLLNILTNAIRYTDDGYVSLNVTGEYLTDGRFEYMYTIQDTGRVIIKGAKELTSGELEGNELGIDYNSGYGISLMVAKKLADALGGQLSVRGVENKGNIYSLFIPSRVVDRRTLGSFNFAEKLNVSFLSEEDNGFIDLRSACMNLGVKTESFTTLGHIAKIHDNAVGYSVLVYDYEKQGRRIDASEKAKSYVKVAVLSENKMPKDYTKDVIFVTKPLSSLTLYKIHLEHEQRAKASPVRGAAFVAPAAKVLVVDDNSLNLDVARNMLERFKVTVDTCANGYECLDLLKENRKYDIIFMDYMMEGMDGIETTKRIREMQTDMKNVPILAYTANAVEGTKEKYLEGGMDGCIYKPASSSAFSNALREFLPRDLLVFDTQAAAAEDEENAEFPTIEGVDREIAMRYSGGNLEMYKEMLSTFAGDIDKNIEKLHTLRSENDFKNFTVVAHSIKGLSRTLGITDLSEKMALMEKAGSKEDSGFIDENLEDAIRNYALYKDLLLPFTKDNKDKKAVKVPSDKVEDALLKMQAALDEFEMDDAENLFKEIWPGEYTDERKPLMQGLKNSIDNVDYYASKDYIDKLLETYEH